MLIHDRVDVAGAQAAMYAVLPHLKDTPKLMDFMPPWYERPQERQSAEAIIDAIRHMARKKPDE